MIDVLLWKFCQSSSRWLNYMVSSPTIPMPNSMPDSHEPIKMFSYAFWNMTISKSLYIWIVTSWQALSKNNNLVNLLSETFYGFRKYLFTTSGNWKVMKIISVNKNQCLQESFSLCRALYILILLSSFELHFYPNIFYILQIKLSTCWANHPECHGRIFVSIYKVIMSTLNMEFRRMP